MASPRPSPPRKATSTPCSHDVPRPPVTTRGFRPEWRPLYLHRCCSAARPGSRAARPRAAARPTWDSRACSTRLPVAIRPDRNPAPTATPRPVPPHPMAPQHPRRQTVVPLPARASQTRRRLPQRPFRPRDGYRSNPHRSPPPRRRVQHCRQHPVPPPSQPRHRSYLPATLVPALPWDPPRRRPNSIGRRIRRGRTGCYRHSTAIPPAALRLARRQRQPTHRRNRLQHSAPQFRPARRSLLWPRCRHLQRPTRPSHPEKPRKHRLHHKHKPKSHVTSIR